MNIEKIKEIVVRGYRTILQRDPDPGGLAHYTNEMQSGRLNTEKLYDILKNSDEYKQKFGGQSSQLPQSSPQSLQQLNNAPLTITYCMMGTNRLFEIKPYVESTLPYIDRFIFIDGGSTDGTVEYLRTLSPNYGNKIEVYYHQWQDKFSGQRNNYLRHFAEKQRTGWILVSDTDEHFTQNTLSRLREAIANASNYNGIRIQVEDIITDINDPNKVVFQKVNPYWKALLFRYHPNIHYEGEPHETLVGIDFNWKNTDLIYQHRRSQRKIYERAVENWFISNSNRYSPKWSEFRSMCTKYGISTFAQFSNLYKQGTLHVDLESWIYNHRNDNSNEGDSEVREMAKLYFGILYPNKRKL